VAAEVVEHQGDAVRIIRNLSEFAVLFLLWGLAQGLIASGWLKSGWLVAVIVALAWGKTAFFGAENLQELWRASRQHVAYHRFMVLMLVINLRNERRCVAVVTHGYLDWVGSSAARCVVQFPLSRPRGGPTP
jgi:hypothetical protein